MKKITKHEIFLEWMLVGLVFVLVFAWAMTATAPGGPDEGMRYQVARYLYKHPGVLPHGEDEAVRNARWGISYAFYPILSYMVSAVFMWITAIFDSSKEALLHGARMADVLFITTTAWLVLRIGRRLFEKEKRWLFSVLVMFLPGFLFMGTYVNTDSLALMACAMILLAWVRYLDEGWTWKNCVLLAVGMAVCFLSYYNAYGWILWSFVFFCVTMFKYGKGTGKERWQFFLSRGMVIAAIVFALAGWWFIRNYIIYDGDFMGRTASTLCAEKYAWEGFKPSEHVTPSNMGWSFKQFLLYQDPGWSHNWLGMVLVSFIGTFGEFSIFMSEGVSKIYILFLFVGAFGVLFMLKELFKGKKGVFNFAMAAAMATPVVLFVWYAFFNDNQAQGRYMISAVFPIMYFVTCGYGKLLDRFVKKEAVRVWFYRVASGLWVLGAVLTYVLVVIPAYAAK